MTAAAQSRPLRFFALVMLGWIALRVAGQEAVLPPALPSLATAAVRTAPPLRRSGPAAPGLSASGAIASTAIATLSAPMMARPAPLPGPPDPAPAIRLALNQPPIAARHDGAPLDMMNFIHFTVGFANRHYASHEAALAGFQPSAAPSPLAFPAPAPPDRWRGSAWLLWRDGSALTRDAVAVGRLGGSQAGLRVDYDLAPKAASRIAAYARATTALQRPAAPEAAIGFAVQPVRAVPVTLAAERRIALGPGARNANAVLAVGGFGPSPVAPGLAAEAYAQAGVVGFRRADLFIDGKLSLLAPLKDAPIRMGGALSGGAQPGASRLDIGPELQWRLPLPRAVPARLSVEWRQRVAGAARPGSGLAITLGADF